MTERKKAGQHLRGKRDRGESRSQAEEEGGWERKRGEQRGRLCLFW